MVEELTYLQETRPVKAWAIITHYLRMPHEEREYHPILVSAKILLHPISISCQGSFVAEPIRGVCGLVSMCLRSCSLILLSRFVELLMLVLRAVFG